MKHGSMFTGIGGFELGFALAGWPVETVWQADVDPYCVRLLKHRFPHATQLGDVTSIDEFPACDVLTAGFPCQPVSQAGRGLAQDDERWLFPYVETAIRTARPELVILENVRGLRSRGLGVVLAALRELGYDCQWDLLPAAAVGAPHLRHRFAIVAYPTGTTIGSIFAVAPPVFAWPPEEEALPRLIKSVPNRKQRLSALGNAVVPHWAAYLALAVERARLAGQLVPETLFGHTVESYDAALPYSGLLIDGMVHETSTCAPKLNGKRLWPTAAANDAEWGLEALRRTVHVDGTPAHDPHMRLYHPDTGQIVQRTLHNYVLGAEEGLWPTPQHADGSGKGAGAGRGSQDDGTWRSINLVDAVAERDELWPTATASDALGSRRVTAQREDWTSNTGTTLTDAAWIEEGVDPHAIKENSRSDAALLWPTASASDHKGVSQPGQRRGQLEEAVKEEEGFWPTPGSADATGGRINSPEARERGVRASGHRVQTTLADAADQADERDRKMWETPTAAPWSHGGGGGELVQQVKQEQGEQIGGWSRDGVAPDDPGRTLNPRWVEWLMGYPAGWTIIPEAEEAAA